MSKHYEKVSIEYKTTKEKIKDIKEKRVKAHKCNGCLWGKWTGVSYKCLLPRCMKGLGDFRRD